MAIVYRQNGDVAGGVVKSTLIYISFKVGGVIWCPTPALVGAHVHAQEIFTSETCKMVPIFKFGRGFGHCIQNFYFV